MTLLMPIGTVVLPTIIRSQPNGNMAPNLLVNVYPNHSSISFKMAELPARGIRAWQADAKTHGINLDSTGCYRPLANQWAIFGGAEARYVPTTAAIYNSTSSAHRKLWPSAPHLVASTGLMAEGRHNVAQILGVTIADTDYWVMKLINGSYPAMAAEPGTSNHGFGCANDLAEIVSGALVSLRPATVQYLYATGARFGFCWETSTEEWHVDWASGDVVPQAVLDYENSLLPPVTTTPPPVTTTPEPPITPPSMEDDLMICIYNCTDADAVFIGYADKDEAAINIQWVSTADRLAAYKARGIHEAHYPAATFITCVIEGPIPTGDSRKNWTVKDFAGQIPGTFN